MSDHAALVAELRRKAGWMDSTGLKQYAKVADLLREAADAIALAAPRAAPARCPAVKVCEYGEADCQERAGHSGPHVSGDLAWEDAAPAPEPKTCANCGTSDFDTCGCYDHCSCGHDRRSHLVSGVCTAVDCHCRHGLQAREGCARGPANGGRRGLVASGGDRAGSRDWEDAGDVATL